MIWEDVLKTKDQESAKQIDSEISKLRIEGQVVNWKDVSKVLDYPYNNMFNKGNINPHFRRTLIEIKILSLTGNIT